MGNSPAMDMAFAERYLLARFPSGGVVVDLESGNYFRVNRSAALVCEVLRATNSKTDAHSRVSEELQISPDEATRAIGSVVAMLSTPATRGEIQGPYHFYPAEGGYGIWHGNRCVLEVDGGNLEICLASDATSEPPERIELYVRALAPKLLFQKEITVLHAAACIAGGKLIAFAGLSGAGKTTTARAFRDAGAKLVSEDLVVLAPSEGRPEMLTGGEAFIHSWARWAAVQLLSQPRKALSSEGLTGFVGGPTVRLDRILFLDRSRRRGTEFVALPIPEPDALISLMAHDFLGAVEPAAWRRFFARAMALLELVEMREAKAPDGVEGLVGAAGRYISSTAS